MVYGAAFFAGKQLQESLVYLFELAVHDIRHGHGAGIQQGGKLAVLRFYPLGQRVFQADQRGLALFSGCNIAAHYQIHWVG